MVKWVSSFHEYNKVLYKPLPTVIRALVPLPMKTLKKLQIPPKFNLCAEIIIIIIIIINQFERERNYDLQEKFQGLENIHGINLARAC